MGAWQPIKTVPKDGTMVLFFGEGRQWVGRIEICDGFEEFLVETTHPIDESAAVDPTHWMPLPSPPGA